MGLCFAPAGGGAEPRVLPASGVVPETRGHGAHERTVNPILMGGEAADSLLVCEVHTPPGHWSSYPPHKHDRDALPEESLLEETYHFRIDPPQGFGLQRVYTEDRSLDETLAVRRRRHRARAARLPHRLRAARLRRLLPQRDGRPDPRVGRGQRPRPRVDV